MRNKTKGDAYSPTIATVVLVLNGIRVDVSSNYVQEITTEFSQGAGGKISLRLFDPDQDTIEDLIIGTPARDKADVAVGGRPPEILDRRLEIAFGWDKGSTNDFPLYRGLITGYEPEYAPEGTTLTFSATNTGIVEAVLDLKTRAFDKGMKTSAIVAEIAKDRGWNAIIEPTNAALDEPVSVTTKSDVAFIREKLLKRSVNAQNQAFVLYWDGQDRMHFHSPGWKQQREARFSQERPLVADYLFGRDAWGEVLSFAPADNALATAIWGGVNATYNAVDSEKGTSQAAKATSSSSPAGASVVTAGGGRFRPSTGVSKSAHVIIPGRTALEFQQLAAARWSALAQVTYRANLTVKGTHDADIGDYIRVRKLRRDGSLHPHSGTFMVIGVRQSYVPGGWTTDFSLSRPGLDIEDAGVKSDAVTSTPTSDEPTSVESSGPQETFTTREVSG